MTLYDLEMDNSGGMEPDTQDRVFTTCQSTTEALLGPVDNATTLALLRPTITAACLNLTRLAKLLYDAAQPFDLDRVAPEGVAFPLYGVASPALIFISLVLNGALVALLLFRRQRMRAETGVLLGEIACLDGLTGVLQLPFLVYAYVLGERDSYPGMAWCKMYWYVSKLLPTIAHTASLWLAAMLATQRRLGVSMGRHREKEAGVFSRCGSGMTKVLCSTRGAVGVSLTCVVLSGILHAPQAVFLSLRSVRVLSKRVLTARGVDVVSTCSLRLRDESLEVGYYYVYTWLRLVLAEFLPCCLIGCFNVSLVRLTRRSSRYRRSLVHGHKASEKEETRGARRTTVMLVTVTTTALLTEVVVVVILLVEFLHLATSHSLISRSVVNHLGVVSNFLITVTLPANFLIYTYMTGHAARTLTALASRCSRCCTCCTCSAPRRRRGVGREIDGGQGEAEGEEGGKNGKVEKDEEREVSEESNEGEEDGETGGGGEREGSGGDREGRDGGESGGEGGALRGREEERGGDEEEERRGEENSCEGSTNKKERLNKADEGKKQTNWNEEREENDCLGEEREDRNVDTDNYYAENAAEISGNLRNGAAGATCGGKEDKEEGAGGDRQEKGGSSGGGELGEGGAASCSGDSEMREGVSSDGTRAAAGEERNKGETEEERRSNYKETSIVKEEYGSQAWDGPDRRVSRESERQTDVLLSLLCLWWKYRTAQGTRTPRAV